MPVVHIFGMEIERKQLLIGGGLIAAAVAVVVFLRARSATAASATAPDQTQPDQSQAGGMSIPAPTSGVADQYQQQLDNAQLQAQTIANTYQQNLVAQQQKQFDLQYKMQQQLEPDVLAEQRSQLAVETHYNKAAADVRLACPGNAGVATDPATGQLYCRSKTGGSIISEGWRAITNFARGAADEAPQIGKQAADVFGGTAIRYYAAEEFPQKSNAANSGNPSARPAPQQPAQTFTPGIAPSPSVGHGYGDV